MFKVGDRVVVVKDEIGKGYWLFRKGNVTDPEVGGRLSVRVSFDDGGEASFQPEELELEEVYDALSAPHPDEETEGENGWFFSGKYKDASEEGSIFLTDELQHEMMEVEGEDVVSNPSHYQSHPSGVECKDVAGHYSFFVGSAIKYLWRHLEKHDDPITDLRKAREFIAFEIERLGGTV